MSISLAPRKPKQSSGARRSCFRQGDWMKAPDWITVKEASELSGYNAEYIRRIMRQGKIKAEKLHGVREWLIDKKTLEA